jgi:hypothetical protein
MSCHGTHVVVIEIPEGRWGAGGQTIDTEKISKLIGATQYPKRLAEAWENAAKLVSETPESCGLSEIGLRSCGCLVLGLRLDKLLSESHAKPLEENPHE